MMNETVLRGAIICALLTTVAACGGSNSDTASTASSSNSSPSSTSSNANGASAVALASSTYVVPTSSSVAVVTINRMGGASGVVSAGYTTVNGTATAGADFSTTSGTVTWADGDTSSRSISVPVKAAAAGKSFSVVLTSVAGAAGFGSPSAATVAMSATTSASSSGTSSSSGGSSKSTSSSADSGCTSSSPTSSTSCLLAFINGLSGQTRHILAGQHSNYWDKNPLDIVTPISAATGSQVAILGLTNFWTGTASTDYGTAPESFVQYANGWLAQGGIVLVSQSPLSPLSSGEAYSDVHTPGTAAYIKWHAFLDKQIAKFKQINGTVIWRPFIELNGKWSWWVSNQNQYQADFKLIWQQMHDYFAANGVTNVLWLFNVNDWDSGADVSAWYPGNAYVDVVSLDAYPPNAKGDAPVYDALVATGKPIMYAEVGVHNSNNSIISQLTYDNSSLLAIIKANFPKIFAVVPWCQNFALPLQLGESAFMSDPAVITLSDVPAAFLNQ